MAKDLKNILLSAIEENKIKEKTPDKLPLNPTAEGWSGHEVRRFLAKSLIDNEGSFLAEFKKKMTEIKAQFEDIFGDGNGNIQGQIDSIIQNIGESGGGSGGGGGITTFVGTREEYDIANFAGQIPSGALVLITDEEEEIPNSSVTTAVLGTATLGSMILGHE